jgi:hypothetical protein
LQGKLCRQILAQKSVAFFGCLHPVSVLKFPEPLINSIDVDLVRSLAGFLIDNDALESNDGALVAEAVSECASRRHGRRKFLAEKSVGGQKVIRLTQALQNQVAQARSHGLAYQQGSRENSHRRRHTQDYRQVGAPEESKIAKQQPA